MQERRIKNKIINGVGKVIGGIIIAVILLSIVSSLFRTPTDETLERISALTVRQLEIDKQIDLMETQRQDIAFQIESLTAAYMKDEPIIPKAEAASADVGEPHPFKVNASDDQQEKINYIWDRMRDVYNIDRKTAKKFLYTFEMENGLWTADRRSNVVGLNGYYDYGLCQFNKGWHPDVVNSPDFASWQWQADRCVEHMVKGTKFYGMNKWTVAEKNFEWYPLS